MTAARVPNTGPAEQKRRAEIRRLEKKLSYFQRIPASMRKAECADEGERDCRALLTELGAAGYERPAPGVALLTINDFIDGLDRDTPDP